MAAEDSLTLVRTLCFGEAIVDLICRRPISSLAEADAFVPSPGGVTANVATAAAHHGASVALAGGAGDDLWGAWLRDRLAAAGVDLHWFGLVPGRATAVAFVTLDDRGEPAWQLYGDGAAATAEAVDGRLLDAVGASDAFLFTSNTLAGKAEAQLTMEAREHALELGRPIVFDPNMRLHRWGGNPGRAGRMAGACVPGAFLVKCNQAEARLMTGEDEPEAAAASLLAAGAQHVIVTRGVGGAILRARGMRLDVRAKPATVLRSTVGAGDVFLGVLIARLGQSDYYPSTLAAALPEAAAEAARACERWGALE
jgi:fructokinase